MDYSRLLQRSFEIVTRHPVLILLGVLAALSGGISGSGNGINFSFSDSNRGDFRQMPDLGQVQPPDVDFSPVLGIAAAALPVLLCFAVIIGLVLWAVGTIARGGLVASVEAVENGSRPTLGDAWRAGVQRAAPLLGISLIPAIPGVFLFVAGIVSFAMAGGVMLMFDGSGGFPVSAGILSMLGVLSCIAVPFALIFGLARTFAERACMIEGLGVVDSYRRGFEVLSANLASAIILFVIQIVISIAVGVLLFLPGLIAALCFLLWPVIWLFNGAMATYFSTVWTLAWRQWTGLAPAVGTV